MAEIIVAEKPQNFTLVDNWILEDTEVFETIHEKMVYIALKKFNFSNCGKVFPGMKRIAQMCMISESTVRRALNQLKDKGLIDIIKRVNENQGQETNVYVLKDFKYGVPETEGGLSEIQGVPVREKEGGPVRNTGGPCHGDTRRIRT